MCLDRLIQQKEKKYFQYEKFKGYSVGYKLYYGQKNKNQRKLTALNYGHQQPVEQWINEKDFRDHENCSIFYGYGYYPTGFHFYPNLKTAKSAMTKELPCICHIRKIYFKRACARGMQGEVPVVVAKEIYICKD
jgi:hypothetical protein